MAKTERIRRSSINGQRNVLTVRGQDPDYHYRVVNDVGDRVNELQEYGYEIVTDAKVKVGDKRVDKASAEGTPVRVSVGVQPNGEVMYGYVMRIRRDWFNEDQKAKRDEELKTEQTMKKEAREAADYGKGIEIT